MTPSRIDDGARAPRVRRPTSTARFGSSKRESHDARAFYERFVPPLVSTDAAVVRPTQLDVIYCGDARDMVAVESGSVALVVTSPPYFAGKEYEAVLGEGGVPASYFEYLAMLRDVFAECARVLEPGGRIAVNVANLGRRPYRSLAGDVTTILQDLGLLLRGEIVWWKGRAAGGSCAWGTFQQPSNPVLRDVTERIVVASKGRFDRALRPDERAAQGLPSVGSISRDEFMEATTDLWELPPERATRVGHPAPFPVALPARLIELYTYADDVVLDPFLGSGTTAVAAAGLGRRYIGFETDPQYVARAHARIAEEATARPAADPVAGGEETPLAPFHAAVREGRVAKDAAAVLLGCCGFSDVRPAVKLRGAGIELDLVARDRDGHEWAFDVTGGFTASRGGLRRTDVLFSALGRAAVVHQIRPDLPFVLLTTDAPTPEHPALKAVRGPGRPVTDVVGLLDPAGHERLRHHAEGA